MFLHDIKDLPRQFYTAHLVVLEVQPSYSFVNILTYSSANVEEVRSWMNTERLKHNVINEYIHESEVHMDYQQLVRATVQRLKKQQTEIMADARQGVQELEDTIQNLLALPKPPAKDFDDE